MNNLVKQFNFEGEEILVVSSRKVAEDFKKEHKNVVKAIQNLTAQNSAVKNIIIESSFNHRGNEYKEYLLTRDGFSLLVMGFTGAKALEWKLKYIEAFNNMEKALKQPRKLTAKEQLELHYEVLKEQETKLLEMEHKVINLENNIPLFNVECKELQAAVKRTGVYILGGKKSAAYKNCSLRQKVYKDIQYQLKRQFGVTRYEAIKRCQYEKALEIINAYTVPLVIEEQIKLTNNQIQLDIN